VSRVCWVAMISFSVHWGFYRIKALFCWDQIP
jgi:hypothetical protein